MGDDEEDEILDVDVRVRPRDGLVDRVGHGVLDVDVAVVHLEHAVLQARPPVEGARTAFKERRHAAVLLGFGPFVDDARLKIGRRGVVGMNHGPGAEQRRVRILQRVGGAEERQNK